MVLNREYVVETAESLKTLSIEDNFRRRVELAEAISNTEGSQGKMALFCIVAAGTEAPEEYDTQLRRHDLVEQATDQQSLLVSGKESIGSPYLSAFIPRGSLMYEANGHLVPVQFQFPGTPEDGSIMFRSLIPTSRDFSGDTSFAHATNYLSSDEDELDFGSSTMASFFADGKTPLPYKALGKPTNGIVVFDGSIELGRDRNNNYYMHGYSELGQESNHGIFSLEQFIASIRGEILQPSDQYGILSLVAQAILQAEIGGRYIIAEVDEYILGTNFYKTGRAQPDQAEAITAAFFRDLDNLVIRAKDLEPITPARAELKSRQGLKNERERKDKLIADKLASLTITITDLGASSKSEFSSALTLDELYEKAAENGYFVYEFSLSGDDYNAAAGDKAKLREMGIVPEDRTDLGTLMSVSMLGYGSTRELAVQRALNLFHTNKMEVPDNQFAGLTLFATFQEGKTLAKVFIPNTPGQPLEATVEVFEGDEEVPSRTFNIEMRDAPLFEVSERDTKTIHESVAWHLLQITMSP